MNRILKNAAIIEVFLELHLSGLKQARIPVVLDTIVTAAKKNITNVVPSVIIII